MSDETVPLPPILVSPEQSARILAAFEGEVTEDTGEPIAAEDAYCRWLCARLQERVIQYELQAIDEQHHAARQQVIADAQTALP